MGDIGYFYAGKKVIRTLGGVRSGDHDGFDGIYIPLNRRIHLIRFQNTSLAPFMSIAKKSIL